MESKGILYRLREVVFLMAGFLILIIIFYFGLTVIETIPDNAIVLVDEKSEIIYSPPLLEQDNRKFLIFTPTEIAEEVNLHLDESYYIKGNGFKSEVSIFKEHHYVWVDETKMTFFPPEFDSQDYIFVQTQYYGKAKEMGFKRDKLHDNWGGFARDENMLQKIVELFGYDLGRWDEDGNWNY